MPCWSNLSKIVFSTEEQRIMSRAKLTTSVVERAIVKSKRRCALCFGLETDLTTKEVQIAHVNRDSSDNSFDNLATLCLHHHNQYDTVPRQTKAILPKELKNYRNKLYDVLEKRDKIIISSFRNGEGKKTQSATSARILGEMLEAYDQDVSRSIGANGIRLTNLAITAARDYGDFSACAEAIRLLLKLDGKFQSNTASGFLEGRHTTPFVSPARGVVEVLIMANSLDLHLTIHLVQLIVNSVLQGENSRFEDIQ